MHCIISLACTWDEHKRCYLEHCECPCHSTFTHLAARVLDMERSIVALNELVPEGVRIVE